MNCLECSTSTPDNADPAIGCCTHCGAGVCLDHAEFVTVRTQPIGVVAQSHPGARRIVCTVCAAARNPGGVRGHRGRQVASGQHVLTSVLGPR